MVIRHFSEVLGRAQGRNVLDLRDIEKRFLRQLLGYRREDFSQLNSPAVVLAHSLTPSEAANLDRNLVLGFVTEVGSGGSHTAIVATALEIPAVVGTGPFLGDVANGDLVVIDGDKGTVILRPDADTLAQYRHEAEELRSQAIRLEELRELPAITADGVRIELLGNIEFPYEVPHCVERGADGVGLYRTEFLYLSGDREPEEEDHFQAYKQVAQAMPSRPVTIRTFDLGADKVPHLPDPEDRRNPSLGLRSIRLSLRHLPMFRTQLRAILHKRLGEHQGYVPLGLDAAGAPPREDGLGGRDGGSRGTPHPLRPEAARGDDGRDSGGRDDDRLVPGRDRFPFSRHERPDPIYAGGGPEQ